QRLSIVPGMARGVFLLLVAGLLVGRRDFAHLNLGDFWRAFKLTPPGFLNYAFVTETILLALSPFALLPARERYEKAEGRTCREKFVNAFGWPTCAVLALMAWGAGHAVV